MYLVIRDGDLTQVSELDDSDLLEEVSDGDVTVVRFGQRAKFEVLEVSPDGDALDWSDIEET